MNAQRKNIAVIGAGMAGLTSAKELQAAGYNVTVFDKGRGPGGRMAARRAEVEGETISFDHGAQYFTATSEVFADQIAEWAAAGIVAAWPAASDDAWVGIPGMNAPVRYMGLQANVRWGTRVERIDRDAGNWSLHTADRTHKFDAVIVAVPAEQAKDLLHGTAPELAAIPAQVTSAPCWALMAAFEARLDIGQDCLPDPSDAIAWAARNSAKPERSGEETWTIHASAEWSNKHLEFPQDKACTMILDEFFEATGAAPCTPVHLAAHRWRYALPKVRSTEPAVWDRDKLIGLCGDYLVSPTVEGAWVSGRTLARKMMAGEKC